ncbi:MAG: metallophosphoesterase [Deltaproteobacteria bacterium]|nr:metallophosphoesterase [Deltaproteobacteria bacterium]
MVIVHLADLHLGYQRFGKVTLEGINQREVDLLKTFEEVVIKSAGLNPQLILVAGDMFDTPKPSNFTLVNTLKLMHHWSGTRVIIIPGNHDKPKRSEAVSPVELLNVYPNVYAVTKNSILRFDDIKLVVFCCVNENDLSDFLNSCPEYQGYHKILVIHCLVEEAGYKASTKTFSITPFLQKFRFNYVALGDLHTKMKIADNCYYCGSTEFVSPNFWNEINSEKVFLQINLPKTEIIEHPIKTVRPLKVFDPIDCTLSSPEDLMRHFEKIIEDGLKEHICRIDIVNPTSAHMRLFSSTKFRNLRQKLFYLEINFIEQDKKIISETTPYFRRTIQEEFVDFLAKNEINEGLKIKLQKEFESFIQNV